MFRLVGLFGYKSWPGIITTYSIQNSYSFSSRLSREQNHLIKSITRPKGKTTNTILDHAAQSPHPMFPTQSVLNSYPARARSESRLRSRLAAYIPSLTHSLAADKNSDPFKWYPVVLRRWRCTAWFVQKPCGCPKREASARWYHGRTSWTCIHTQTHIHVLRPYIRKVPDVRPRSTEIMSGALQISQLSDKGREPKGWELIMRRTDLGTTTCICCYSWVLYYNTREKRGERHDESNFEKP